MTPSQHVLNSSTSNMVHKVAKVFAATCTPDMSLKQIPLFMLIQCLCAYCKINICSDFIDSWSSFISCQGNINVREVRALWLERSKPNHQMLSPEFWWVRKIHQRQKQQSNKIKILHFAPSVRSNQFVVSRRCTCADTHQFNTEPPVCSQSPVNNEGTPTDVRSGLLCSLRPSSISTRVIASSRSVQVCSLAPQSASLLLTA